MGFKKTVIKSRINRLLLELDLTFIEDDTRMDSGRIGNITYDDKIGINIYPHSFYVHNNHLPINNKTIELIQLIQKELVELTFKDGKPQLLYPKINK